EFNRPPKPEIGDFSTAAALKLAKAQRRKPLEIAGELAERLRAEHLPHIGEITVTPPGFINFRIAAKSYAGAVIGAALGEREAFGRAAPAGKKVLIEHTNVNPNKAMHIGHVRNAMIGDAVARMLGAAGRDVEACNYIDDTGVQVVDVVTALLYLREPRYAGGDDFSPIWAKAETGQTFDYFCWDLYSEVQGAFDADAALKARRDEVMHQIEAGGNPIAGFAKELASRIVRCHLKTMERLLVFYDLLNWESDILERGFWDAAFERLKVSGAIVHETEGPNAGCWVVPFGGITETKDGIKSQDKVLVRSNGTITYTAKDIAYQLWKFGLLDADFLYRVWGLQADGRELWTSAPDGEPCPRFGRADDVVNVIDVRQSYAQQIVYHSLAQLGYTAQAERSHHLSYEVVSLSSAAARELGVAVEEGGREVHAMSGRQGIGVKADDLIDLVVRKLREKSPEPGVAERLAAAAIRYYMLKFTLTSMIIFDFDAATQATGDSGVYLVYSYVRANNILEKAGGEPSLPVEAPGEPTPAERALLIQLDAFGDTLRRAADALTPSMLASYAFELAQTFTAFYEQPGQELIIHTSDAALKRYRIALVAAFRQVMGNTLAALGVPVVERV
ncbi:MAG: arginine--tRNA ligase, partial [Dehalococcoidia bacterium]